MSDYTVEIEGRYTLSEIELQIAGEEAGASEFQGSTVGTRNNRPTNLVTFRGLPAGTLLKPLRLIEAGGAAPSPSKRVWTGVMVVSGTNTAVEAYRVQ